MRIPIHTAPKTRHPKTTLDASHTAATNKDNKDNKMSGSRYQATYFPCGCLNGRYEAPAPSASSTDAAKASPARPCTPPRKPPCTHQHSSLTFAARLIIPSQQEKMDGCRCLTRVRTPFATASLPSTARSAVGVARRRIWT